MQGLVARYSHVGVNPAVSKWDTDIYKPVCISLLGLCIRLVCIHAYRLASLPAALLTSNASFYYSPSLDAPSRICVEARNHMY